MLTDRLEAKAAELAARHPLDVLLKLKDEAERNAASVTRYFSYGAMDDIEAGMLAGAKQQSSICNRAVEIKRGYP